MIDQLYIGVTGHRDMICSDMGLIEQIYYFYPGAIWIHGGAEGFDTQIDNFIKSKGEECEIIRPDYKLYRDKPKFAPIARNYKIVDKSHFLVALWNYREEGGTYRTIKYARQNNKFVHFVYPYQLVPNNH